MALRMGQGRADLFLGLPGAGVQASVVGTGIHALLREAMDELRAGFEVPAEEVKGRAYI